MREQPGGEIILYQRGDSPAIMARQAKLRTAIDAIVKDLGGGRV